MDHNEKLWSEISMLKESLRRLSTRIQHGVRPARQSEVANETDVIQGIRVNHNSEEIRNLKSMQFYGFASSPLPGCDHMTIQIAGDNNNGIAIASNDQRYRPTTLGPGDIALHNNVTGLGILLSGNNIIITTPNTVTLTAPNIAINATNSVVITTPTTHIKGNLVVDGLVTSSGNNVSLSQHTHTGVKSGSDNSGIPNAGH